MDGGRPLRFGTVSPADCADGDAEMTHRDLDCVLPALRNLSAGTVVEYFGIRIIRNANESESEMIDEERQIGEAMAALPVVLNVAHYYGEVLKLSLALIGPIPVGARTWSVYFFDPNGIRLELSYQEGDGEDIRVVQRWTQSRSDALAELRSLSGDADWLAQITRHLPA